MIASKAELIFNVRIASAIEKPLFASSSVFFKPSLIALTDSSSLSEVSINSFRASVDFLAFVALSSVILKPCTIELFFAKLVKNSPLTKSRPSKPSASLLASAKTGALPRPACNSLFNSTIGSFKSFGKNLFSFPPSLFISPINPFIILSIAPRTAEATLKKAVFTSNSTLLKVSTVPSASSNSPFAIELIGFAINPSTVSIAPATFITILKGCASISCTASLIIRKIPIKPAKFIALPISLPVSCAVFPIATKGALSPKIKAFPVNFAPSCIPLNTLPKVLPADTAPISVCLRAIPTSLTIAMLTPLNTVLVTSPNFL